MIWFYYKFRTFMVNKRYLTAKSANLMIPLVDRKCLLEKVLFQRIDRYGVALISFN
jgi:hypothetical protein